MALKFEIDLTDRHITALSEDVLSFLENLCEHFGDEINELLNDRGNFKPQFLKETEQIRNSDWIVGPIPDEVQDRRVEITGPPEQKMIINALNSGANVYMADFEDSNSPTWSNCINGQIYLNSAINRKIDFYDENRGKSYKLNNNIATLFIRPRGLHLKEKHVTLNGDPIPAALFDYGVFVGNNINTLINNGTRPYFYLPKLEHHLEARLWNKVFSFTEDYFGVERGTIKATVLIETLPAAFQMDEILFELRDHSAGLNCGRWDYIFSFIKTFRHDSNYIIPDRDSVGMTQHFMRSYSQLLIQTCHKRGAHAMGGMAAQIPIKGDAIANSAAIRKVEQDKSREVMDGHDGTWVAHPGLVSIAREVFNDHMPWKNQINKSTLYNRSITPNDLITVPIGTCTEGMLRKNIRIGYEYTKAWIAGNGCVPLNNLMEDAATAEISRAQIWQWLHHSVLLENGKIVTKDYVEEMLQDELSEETGTAYDLWRMLCFQDNMDEFLTLQAYNKLEIK